MEGWSSRDLDALYAAGMKTIAMDGKLDAVNQGILATTRSRDNSLISWAATRFNWARITHGGKFHRFEEAIVRWRMPGDWRFNNVSWDRPNVTMVSFCGPQVRLVFDALQRRPNPVVGETCLKCESVISRKEAQDGVCWG